MQLEVTVHPNAKTTRVDETGGVLHVYVNQPARDGLANIAVAKLLAQHFTLSKSRVTLLRGAKSKKKIFEILK